jgi:enamine deaminase RidA (YjgF/YER057c/UK114 family)
MENLYEKFHYAPAVRDIMLFLQVKDRYFTQDYPTWTATSSPALAMPGLLVEIKATAVLPR